MRKITLLLILLSFSYSLSAQTYLQENFDTEIPATWTVTDGGAATGDSWISGQQGGANSLDGTNGAVVDSDANGNGTQLLETLTSPVFDTTGAVGLFLDFDQFYRNGGNDTAVVEVYNGSSWVEILDQIATAGAFNNPDQQHIDITAYSNANMQIRFVYDDADVWAWYWMVDNIHVYNSLCDIPTALEANNVTGTTADITWDAGTITAWEYVVQPAGTGEPTTNGTATATNTVNLSALTYSTDYEVYVRSDCSGSFSNWVGPLNFTTTVQVDFTVDCAVGAQTVNYCYENNDSNVFTFTSTDGSALSLTINAGQVENNWDELVVTDSDGTTDLNAATPYGNAGDVSGITYQSSGDTISFTITSDGSGSCTTNGYTPLDVSVVCATCTNPTATYAVVSDCGNGPQFFVETDVTSLGTATSVTVTDNQMNSQQVSATGVVSFGPYPNNTDVVITVTNDDDANCSIVSNTTLTQEICLDYTVDCMVGPTSFTYCYENNDTNVFTFTSTDGSPLNFIVNAGQVENGWDELVVTDIATGTDLNAGTPYGNNGDVSGISYQSTGDSISFTVTSDGSVNCAGNGFTPLDITVSCATCINPTATYSVIDDCANGDQFLVDVNITSLGDATSLLIEDNQGSPSVSVSATGITQFGPYPFLTDIIFTISNEQDINCVITSSAIQIAACPPDNDNCPDATVAVVNEGFLCEEVTPGTLVEATDSGVPAASCGGNADDDVWFQFTALNEFQLISLTNLQGSETFNIDFVLYEGSCDALTEIACQDGFPPAFITPQLVVGNTYYIRIFSGGNDAETTTFDLCITPYVMPTNITCEASENFCPAGEEGGALYISNIVDMPNNSSVACLGTIPNPTYSVLEIGTSGDILVEIVQNTAFDSNENPIGNTLDVDYVLWGPFAPDEDYCNLNLEVDCPSCPNNTSDPNFYPFGNIADCSYSAAAIENFTIENAVAGDFYLILVTNFANDPGIIQITQTNTTTDPDAGTLTSAISVDIVSNDAIFIDDDNDDTTPSVANLCGYDSVILEADSPFADVYEWSINGIIDPTLTTSTITVTESNTYSVTVYDTQCSGFDQQTVIVNLYQEAIVNVVPPDEVNIITCDDESGDGIEDFNLENLTSIILDAPGQNPADFLVTYHETLNDAQTGMNALVSPYSATDGTVIYVRVEDVDSVGSGSGCASTNTTFSLVVLGALPTATSADMETCDDDSRDGIESFDLDSNSVNILNGQDPATFIVSYYATQTDADAGMNALTSPYDNTSNPQTIFARVENNMASDCYKTTPLDLIVNDIPVTSFDDSTAYEVCPNATVPITITAIGDNFTESGVTIAWYNESVLISGQTSLELSTVLTQGTYSIEVTFNDTGCTSITDVLVTELPTCVIPQGISPNGDGLNDSFDLSSYDVQSLEVFNRNGTLVYSKANYLNEWSGQSKNGDELPVGTYYYVMKYQGNKTKAAWVYINRAN